VHLNWARYRLHLQRIFRGTHDPVCKHVHASHSAVLFRTTVNLQLIQPYHSGQDCHQTHETV
jgi:hypothetical protein